ncbi:MULTISPECIES: S41 family peptidase [Chitinophagaceae]
MKTVFFLTMLLLLSSSAFSQSIQKLTPSQMTQDIDTLVSYLEKTHINPYYKYPKEKLYNDVNLVKRKLTADLDLFEFYLRIEPLLAKLEDGHTDLPIPKEIYNAQNPYELPYVFKLTVKKPYIVCKEVKAGFSSDIPINAEIISINSIPAQKIVEDIVSLNTGENPDFRAEYGANNFSFYLENLYKTNGNYTIKYKLNKGINAVRIKGVRQKELIEKSNQSNPLEKKGGEIKKRNFSLAVKNNIAIIDFKKFDWNGFKKFADSTFSLVKEREINNIIINLIDNGGGDSDVGDAFLQYILDEPFKQYNKVVVKNSQFYKDRVKKNIGSKKLSQEESDFLNQKNGTIDTFFMNTEKIKDSPLRYKGNIYLLINSQTYSSASDFAQCFKFYKRGTIIGEETGGLIKSFGDIVTAHLPNSNLRLTISSTLYYNIGADDNDFIGVIPDVFAPKDSALKKAMEIIGRKK